MGLALALGCLFVSPIAAAAVGARTLVTLVALLVNGPGWTAGLRRLIDSRRRAFGLSGVAGTWAEVEDMLTRPQELALSSSLAELFAAAWCEANIRTIAATALKVVRGLVFGVWPLAASPRQRVLLLQMMVAESVTNRFFQTVAALSGGAIGFVFSGTSGLHLLGHDLARWLTAIIGAVVAWNWARLRPRTLPQSLKRSLPVMVVFSAAVYFVLGFSGLWVLVASTVVGMAAGLINKKTTRLHTPRISVSALPARLRWRRGHGFWQAGRTAMNDGRQEAADRLWRQLATGSIPAHEQIRALSQAMLASLALDRAAWQESVEWADQAVAATPMQAQAGYLTRVVGARVMLAAGNPAQSVALLREAENAGFARRLRRDPVTRMVFARALAMTGNVKEAQAVLSRIRGGLRGTGLGRMIESEAVVATMSGEKEIAAATERLRSMLEWVEDPQITEAAASPGDEARLGLAAARAWLALGNLEFRLGEFDAAESSLRRAVKALPMPAEVANRATAQVLLGCALAVRQSGGESLTQIGEGLSDLEGTRGQLRNSFLRSQLVLQLDDVYSRALDALQAQQAATAGPGQVAAVLLESLRRDALASLLRQGGTLELRPQARTLQGHINDLESRTLLTEEEASQLAALRSRLSTEISNLYTEAYSPSSVALDDVRQRASHAHVLTFKIAQADNACLRGHSVWIPPEGEPYIAPVMLTDPDLLAAIGLRGKEERAKLMKNPQYPGDPEFQRWLDMGERLLPVPLRTKLSHATRARPERLVIVPDGPLSAFPWAGIRITDGRHLAEVAIIHVIPAMSMMETERSRPSGSPAVTHTSAGGEQISYTGMRKPGTTCWRYCQRRETSRRRATARRSSRFSQLEDSPEPISLFTATAPASTRTCGSLEARQSRPRLLLPFGGPNGWSSRPASSARCK